MLLPVGDTPNPSRRAWITWALIAANVLVFLLTFVLLSNVAADSGDPLYPEVLRVLRERGLDLQQVGQRISAFDLVIFRYGYRPAEPSLTALFSSLFLHGGWLHLVGNMLFLWIFGNNVENRLGPGGYLVFYLAAGVAATLFFSLFASASRVPMLGASGAISGILGCYFLWFPRNKVKVFILLFPIFLDVVLVPSRIVLGVYLLIDNLVPFLIRAGAASGVAHGAHIGGFLAGLAVALVWRRKAPREGRG